MTARPERAVCSAVSAADGEPLVGTASRHRLWLMVEQPGPWGHHALTESGLPDGAGRALRDLGRGMGVRVVLVKQRRRRSRSRRVFLAYTGSRQRRVRVLDVDDPAAVLDLDLPALAARRFTDVGAPFDRPLFLVCTHGKHDQCCALHGAPLARALDAAVDDVWECTHIGGDRFAGNLVCYPHGLYFGRVPPAEAVGVAEEYAAGRVSLPHFRGRSAFSPPVQAAEIEIRRRTGIVGVDDLELVEHEPGEETHRVAFRGPRDEVHEVTVRGHLLDPRLLTCKATHPHRPRVFAVEG